MGESKVVHFAGTFGSSSYPFPWSSFGFSASTLNPLSACNFPNCGFRHPNSGVVLSCLDCFLANGSLYRFEYGVSKSKLLFKLRGGTCTTAESDPPELVIHKAMYLLEHGFGEYSVMRNNCEHFAMYCKTGLVCIIGGSGQAFVFQVPFLASEEEKLGLSHFQSKKLENWEDQISSPSLRVNPSVVDVKQEVAQSRRLYGHGDDEFQTCRPSWSHQVMPVSCPRSCVTNLSSSNMLDFSNNKIDGRNQHPDHSPECNSTATGGVPKKARVQSSSTQPPLKVRKEKLGDRITALHQLVSPFGKTDTASVLLEVIGYIGFLQSQIEALSSPYFCNASANLRHQQSVQGERNCTLVVDSGQGNQETPKDLRSRGLCLVPVSCTHHVGNDNGADYWAPALGGGF